MMILRHHRRTLVVLVAAIVMVTAACGSGGSGGSEGSKAPSSTTSAAPKKTTTTTTEPAPQPADAETVALAKAGVAASGDYPSTWTLDTEAESYEDGTPTDACVSPDGSPLQQLPAGALQAGPTMASDQGEARVSTLSAAFADEATASEWADYIGSEDYSACYAEALQASYQDDAITIEETTTPEVRAELGTTGLVRAGTYELSRDGEMVSQIFVYGHRVGRVVFTSQSEVAQITEDQIATFTDVESNLRGALIDRVAAAQGIDPPA